MKMLPEIDVPCEFQEIQIQQCGPVCFVYFDFYNGAMDTWQAGRLEKALKSVGKLECQFVVLMGGERFFSTGVCIF